MTLDVQPDVTPPPARRRRRWVLPALLGVVVLVLVAAGVTFLVLSRPPSPVSVPDVIDRFRTASPGATARTGPLPPAPAAGVYVYATTGSERISAGGVKHTYPRLTTLSVTYAGCGLTAKWEALAGRWQEWQLCPRDGGWAIASYVDAHKFLYMQDIHRYTCYGGAWSTSAATTTVTCDAGTSVLTSVVRRVGTESVRVEGAKVAATHLRVEQSATGASTSSGTLDVWLAAGTGLPVKAQIASRGSQTVLGQDVTYRENANFTLTSMTPRR